MSFVILCNALFTGVFINWRHAVYMTTVARVRGKFF